MKLEKSEIEKILFALKKPVTSILKNGKLKSHEIQTEKAEKIVKISKNIEKTHFNNQENIRIIDQKSQETNSNFQTDSLKDGTFDEEKSHQYFLEALLEFRAGKKQDIEEKPEENKEKPKPFFFYNENLETQWHNTLDTEKKEESIGTDQPLKKKESAVCWECLKTFDKLVEKSFHFKVSNNLSLLKYF